MQKILIALSLLLIPLLTWGQVGDEIPENDQIRAQRAAYITQRLNLNTSEAAHFWTVFEEYEAEKKALRRSFNQGVQRPATEEEAHALIEKRLELDQGLVDLKRRYYTRLREQVPAQKLVLLPTAEREFKRNILRQLRQRRQGRGG